MESGKFKLPFSNCSNTIKPPTQQGSNVQERQDKDHYERWPVTVKLFYLRTTAEKHSLDNSKEYNINYWSWQHKFSLNIQLQKKKNIIAHRKLVSSPETTVNTVVPVLPLPQTSLLAFWNVSHSPLAQNNRNTDGSYLAL